MKFDETDKRIFELAVSDPRLSDEQIAGEIGLSRESVTRRKQKEGYQSLLQGAVEPLQNTVKRISEKAVAKLEMLLDDPDTRVQLGAIALVLRFFPEAKPKDNFEGQNFNEYIALKCADIERLNKLERDERTRNESQRNSTNE